MRWILLLLIIFGTSLNVMAQCCAQGSPMGGSSNQGIMEKGKFRTITFFRYSSSVKNKLALDYEPIRSANYTFLGSRISYGMSNKITLDLDLGYFFNKSQVYDFGSEYIFRGFGLSNGIISGRTLILKNEKRNLEVSAGAGLKFPFNRKYQVVNGIELPVDNQVSTTAFGVVPRVLIFKKFPEKKAGLFFLLSSDYNFRNYKDYRYGPSVTSAVFFSKVINFVSCNTFGIIQLRNEYRFMDVLRESKVESTGAEIVYVSPQINQMFKQKYNVSVSVDIPVYQQYNSLKLVHKYAASLIFVADF